MQLSYFTNGAAGLEKLHGPRVIHIFLFKYMPYLINYSNSRLSFDMALEMPFFSCWHSALTLLNLIKFKTRRILSKYLLLNSASG